jgi:hypothetical protein
MNVPVGTVTREPTEVALSEIGGAAEAALKLRIHDSSRIEWSVSVPLPADRRLSYEIEARLEVPATAASRHAPWDQLQVLSRLDGPTDIARSPDVTVDSLRRGAVTLTQMLARAREGFARHCRTVASSQLSDFEGGERGFLLIWLEAALRAVREAREELTRGQAQDAPLIVRERALIDEFVSVRLLEMLADAQRVLREAPPAARERSEVRIAQALRDEFAYREQRGLLHARPDSPEELDAYISRAARLKKHFEEVLFLERETEQLDERMQQWMGTVGALIGGIAAFLPIQIALTRRPPGPIELGWGLAALALLAGIGYAARHRMREWGRSWLAGKVYRFHAQRITRCRVPARRLATREVLVEAREWCHQTTSSRPDPLNPEAGASLPATQVRYVHKGAVLPQSELAAAGVRRVRHIFRYDLSPLFPRLDDDLKPVPVLGEDGAVRFVGVPRSYRVPIELRLAFASERYEDKAEIVLDKNGLRRIERA